jgi:hypothetical protein
VGTKPTPEDPRPRPLRALVLKPHRCVPSARLSGGHIPRPQQSRPALIASRPAPSSPLGRWADDSSG